MFFHLQCPFASSNKVSLYLYSLEVFRGLRVWQWGANFKAGLPLTWNLTHVEGQNPPVWLFYYSLHALQMITFSQNQQMPIL